MLTPFGLAPGANSKMRSINQRWLVLRKSAQHARFAHSALRTCIVENRFTVVNSLSLRCSTAITISSRLFHHSVGVPSLGSRRHRSYQRLLNFFSRFASCLGTTPFQPR